MITLDEYFGKWKGTEEQIHNAVILLGRVNKLHDHLVSKGVTFPYNPVTKSLVSGEKYGGFRPQSCPIGAPQSAHKDGKAIDLYDPLNEIDDAILADPDILVQFDLYIEHPEATDTWSHWSSKPPKSGKRIFYP